MKNNDRIAIEAAAAIPTLRRKQQTHVALIGGLPPDERSRRIDGLLRLAFDILGAPFPDMSAQGEAEQ